MNLLSFLCGATCGNVADLPEQVTCPKSLSDVGAGIMLVKCDFQFTTNVLDTGEWLAAITAGDIRVYNNITFGKNTADQDTVDFVSCGRNKKNTTIKGTAIPCTVSELDHDNKLHIDFFDALSKDDESWRIVLFTKREDIYVNPAWFLPIMTDVRGAVGGNVLVAGQSIGMQYSFNQVIDTQFDQTVEGLKDAVGEIYVEEAQIMKPVKIAGLLTAVNACI